MPEKVEHQATVVSVDQGRLTLSIAEGDGCAGCGIAMVCSSPGGGTLVTVAAADASAYAVGERVRLTAAATSAVKAMAIGVGLPCAALLAVVLALLAVGVDPTWAAAAGLAAVAVYYLALYLLRQEVNGRVVWTVERL